MYQKKQILYNEEEKLFKKASKKNKSKKYNEKSSKSKVFVIIIILLIIFLIIPVNKKENKNVEVEVFNYIKNCSSQKELKKYNQTDFKFLSIIVYLFNAEKHLLRLLSSIQNQEMHYIEIILIDDASKDDTLKKIKQYKKLDKRIILIKNKVRKGSLYSKVKGIETAKGNYVTFINQEDIFLNNFSLLYNYTRRERKEIVDFQYFIGNETTINYKSEIIIGIDDIQKMRNEPFDNSFGNKIFINKKLIARTALLRTILKISDELLSKRITLYDDIFLIISLFSSAKSYEAVNILGYYQLVEESSQEKIKLSEDDKNIKEEYRNLLILFKFVFDLKTDSIEVFNKRVEWIYEFICKLLNKYPNPPEGCFENLNNFIDYANSNYKIRYSLKKKLYKIKKKVKEVGIQ